MARVFAVSNNTLEIQTAVECLRRKIVWCNKNSQLDTGTDILHDCTHQAGADAAATPAAAYVQTNKHRRIAEVSVHGSEANNLSILGNITLNVGRMFSAGVSFS